jgi:hypothetical protein
MLTQRTAVVAQVVSYELGVRLHCCLALKDISLHYDTVVLPSTYYYKLRLTPKLPAGQNKIRSLDILRVDLRPVRLFTTNMASLVDKISIDDAEKVIGKGADIPVKNADQVCWQCLRTILYR